MSLLKIFLYRYIQRTILLKYRIHFFTYLFSKYKLIVTVNLSKIIIFKNIQECTLKIPKTLSF